MACPAPHARRRPRTSCRRRPRILAAHLAPRTRGLSRNLAQRRDRSTDRRTRHDVEPIYGKVYLPRKFKTGLALPEDNCIDVYAQDLGLLAIVEDGQIVGYNVLVGGGMGMTHGNANTFPHLARPICYVPAGAVVAAAEAVVRLFRDHGNRADRKRARIKYLVHDWGVEKFREVLAGYLGGALVAAAAGRGRAASIRTSAGTRRATASGSTASASRTAGSRTRATSGCAPACARSSSDSSPSCG